MSKIRSVISSIKDLLHDLTALDYLVLLLTITGVNAQGIIQTFFPQVPLPGLVTVLSSTVLVVFIVAFFGGKRGAKTRHLFEENTADEAKFFDKWYRKPGHLIMFCSDVKWLEEDRFLSVRDALLKKGAGLELYIKDHEHNFVKELKIYGAKVHVVKQNLRSVHRFSILLSDGFESIIIRNKEYETENIQIDEYKNNPALVNLARDMLDDCIIQREDI